MPSNKKIRVFAGPNGSGKVLFLMNSPKTTIRAFLLTQIS